MKFSRNPISGEMETYTDDGVYMGNVFTIGDMIGSDDKIAQDGGPGSGNFGHKGRPGKVGGSGPGGGKQYRGGRADIGYFSSRKDWLNGLSGEKQAEASKFIETHRAIMKESQRAKERLNDLWKRGFLTQAEVDERLKKEGLEKLRDDMTPEEYIMKCGSRTDRNNLVYHVGEARNWTEYKDRLMKENLSEDEQKVMNWIYDNVRNFNDYPDYVNNTFSDLKAKAMGLPNSGDAINDEMLYMSGVKERPAVSEKLNWYKPSTDRSGTNKMMETCMLEAIGKERPQDDPYLRKLSNNEFSDLNQEFLDTLKYKDLDKDALSRASYAVTHMKDASGFDENKNYADVLTDEDKEVVRKAYEELEKHKIQSLTRRSLIDAREAKERLQKAKERKLTDEDFTGEKLSELHKGISWTNPNTKDFRKATQDLLIVENKLMTGMEPRKESDSDVYKELQRKKEEEKRAKEEAKRKAEERAKRDEVLKAEEQKRHDDGVKNGNPMFSYERDEEHLNREHLDDVIKGVNPYYNQSKLAKDNRYLQNCQRCVVAFVARLRGYNVESKPRLFPANGSRDPVFLNGGETKFFEGATDDHVEGKTGDAQRANIEKNLKNWGDGAIGLVSVAWQGRQSAHIFVAMNDNGVIKWIDPQNPSRNAGEYVKNGVIQPWYTKMIRVDDKPFTHWVHEAIRPVGGQYDDHFK